MSLLADESTRPPITTAGPLGVFAAGPTSVSVSRSDTPAFALAYVRNAHEPAVRWPPVNGGSWPIPDDQLIHSELKGSRPAPLFARRRG